MFRSLRSNSRDAGEIVLSAAAYLGKLNSEQRRAVEHGVGGASVGGPLLVIAGAGSGKTNTLAHRVAHLIATGADPRRILLMTFSRRAASEMCGRVQRICAEALGAKSGVLVDALAWSGTFHGIGARLLREYAPIIGLDPDFTIHDREDSADLLNLVRHDLGFSKTAKRFPTKATCLSIYSRAVNSEAPLDEVLGKHFPWCAGWSEQLRALFAAYVEAKQAQNVLDYDDLLLYWAQMSAEPALASEMSARFDHVLVDEYQDTNRLQASILSGLKPDGRGLTVVGDDAQSIYSFRAADVRNILDFPQAILAARGNRHARPQLPLDPADPRRRQWRDRLGQGALRQKPSHRARFVAASRAGRRARRGGSGGLHRRKSARGARGRRKAQVAGGPVPRRPSQRAAGSRADPAQHSLREIRRPEIPRQRPCQGSARLVAFRAEPARPRRRFPPAADPARRRSLHRPPRARRDRRGERPGRRPRRDAPAREIGRFLAGLRRRRAGPARKGVRLARGDRARQKLVSSRISNACTRMPRRGRSTSSNSNRSPRLIRRASAS